MTKRQLMKAITIKDDIITIKDVDLSGMTISIMANIGGNLETADIGGSLFTGNVDGNNSQLNIGGFNDQWNIKGDSNQWSVGGSSIIGDKAVRKGRE